MSYGIDIKTEVQGLADLEKMLLDLLLKDAKRVLRKAAKDSMTPVQLSMAVNAGFNSESNDAHMREEIEVKTKMGNTKAGKDTALTVRVGPKKEHVMKAIAQEYGTYKQAARPFMRPALQDNMDSITQCFKDTLSEQIGKTQRKYARQARRAARDA